jgi:hypothetical protein
MGLSKAELRQTSRYSVSAFVRMGSEVQCAAKYTEELVDDESSIFLLTEPNPEKSLTTHDFSRQTCHDQAFLPLLQV